MRGKPTRLDLAQLLGSDLPTNIPHYLNLRSVAHKLAQRIKLLEAGESPEALKLGRTLSAAAAIRLLKDLEQHLYHRKKRIANDKGEIELVFGTENAYAVLNNRLLNPAAGQGDSGGAVNYQRMAIFGRDQVSELPTSKKRLKVDSEPWTLSQRPRHARAEGQRLPTARTVPRCRACRWQVAARRHVQPAMRCRRYALGTVVMV